MVACCWLLDFDRILRRTPDDAYYYFKIAENIAAGHGPTFDGLHRTSGFQPLWMLCLTPVFWVCPNSPETAVRIGLSLQAALLFVAGLLIVSVLRKAFPWKTVLGATVCYTFAVFLLAVNGMETAMVILTLAMLLALGCHARVFAGDRPTILKKFPFGLLLGLVMLARLDTVFLGAAIVIVCGVAALRRPGGRLRGLAGAFAVFAGASSVVLPYLLYNRATLGAASPISGAIKSGFPHVSLRESWSALTYCVGLPKMALLVAILAGALAYVAWYSFYWRRLLSPIASPPGAVVAIRAPAGGTNRDARFYFHTSIAVFGCAILLHAANIVLFMKWAIWTWHFFPYFLFAALAVAAPLERLSSTRVGRVLYWPTAVSVVAVGVLGYGLWMTRTEGLSTWQTASYRAALWARDNTAPSDVFALKDTGNFGYFSRRRVINLDGVVNNLEFQEVLRERKLGDYFRRNHVKYLVLHATKESHPRVYDGTYETDAVAYRSNLYDAWSDAIPLRRQDEVDAVTYEYREPDKLVIWNISPLTGAP
jgi:hypothetical protein